MIKSFIQPAPDESSGLYPSNNGEDLGLLISTVIGNDNPRCDTFLTEFANMLVKTRLLAHRLQSSKQKAPISDGDIT